MKCSECGEDSKRKEREANNGRCPTCQRYFVFDPNKKDPVSDHAFKTAVSQVSAEGAVKFTEDHLYFELNRRVRRIKAKGALPATTLLSGVSAVMFFATHSVVAWVPAAFGAAVAFAWWRSRWPGATLNRVHFTNLLERWIDSRGRPPGLLDLNPRVLQPVSQALQTELEAYSFDRAVITDTAETAEVLLANDFHFENNCAVLSVDGHPRHAFDAVRKMLRNNPRIEVFALHDCTPGGCMLAHRLRNDEAWFKGVGQVHDVALRPRQAKARVFEPSWEKATDARQHPSFSEAEREWLAKWNLLLAAIRPEQLIKRLYRAMQALPGDGLPSGDGGTDDTLLFATHSDAIDGGADSFG